MLKFISAMADLKLPRRSLQQPPAIVDASTIDFYRNRNMEMHQTQCAAMKEAFDSSLPPSSIHQEFTPSDFVSFALDSEIIGPINNYPLQVNMSVSEYPCEECFDSIEPRYFSAVTLCSVAKFHRKDAAAAQRMSKHTISRRTSLGCAAALRWRALLEFKLQYSHKMCTC
jgi:hypothetical protein